MKFHQNLMKYHTLFFRKFGKMLKNLSSAAVVIGAIRVKRHHEMKSYLDVDFS